MLHNIINLILYKNPIPEILSVLGFGYKKIKKGFYKSDTKENYYFKIYFNKKANTFFVKTYYNAILLKTDYSVNLKEYIEETLKEKHV